VLAELTPEEVNEDRLGVARHLSEEEDLDPKELGLQLDVLKIQHVSDEVGHLPAIGEKATAEAIRCRHRRGAQPASRPPGRARSRG